MSRRWEWSAEEIGPGLSPWPRTLLAVWAPLIDLTPAETTQPVKLHNLGYLLDRSEEPAPAAEASSFPLASYLSPPLMRQWLAVRAGRQSLAFARLPLSGTLPGRWQQLQRLVGRFPTLHSGRKAWVLSTLSQLTLYEEVVELAQGLELNLDLTSDAATAYEVGRALQRIDIAHSLPVTLFKQILQGNADTYLRAACAIQFMVRGSRYQRDASMALRASLRGERLLKAEAESPRDPFRHALMCSRLFRADALVRVVHGGSRSPAAAMQLARVWHDRAASLAGDDAERKQLARENLRLVVEAEVKHASFSREIGGEHFVRDLLQIDGTDPDCLAFAGDYWSKRDEWRKACALYFRSMRAGTVRGVQSAMTAGDLLAAKGRPPAAMRAWTWALLLDPRCVTARQRLQSIPMHDNDIVLTH
jgi:hypothetical protein